jgi:coenzyme A diphosphatase NUDT7
MEGSGDGEMDSLVAHLGSIGMEPQDLPHHAAMPRASVLVALFLRSGKPHMLLTKRTMTLKSHSGQVCFPGGKQDPEDLGDDVVTALREANEEVGLQPSLVQPLCRLVPMESVTGLCVTPIVAYISKSIEPSSLALSEHEVEAAFCVPVSYFLDEHNCASKQNVEWSGGIFCMRTYFFQSNERNFKIWGLTAHIAHQVAEIAMGTATVCPLVGSKEKEEMIVSGHLFRLEGSSTRPFWSRYFFVCNGQMLHQYKSEHEASRKSSSANKKNRLQLKYCQVIVADSEQDNKHPFLVSALDGRVQWHLAAQEKEDRQRWTRILLHYSNEIA